MVFEILGHGLKPYFKRLGLISPKCTYFSPTYEVWKIQGFILTYISEMSDEEFYALFPDEDEEFPWWRYCEGSVLSPPYEKVIINKEKIVGWKRSLDPNEVPEYPDLLSYLCNEIGVSTEKNICAVAKDLAKYNGMTMGELFTRLQPVR